MVKVIYILEYLTEKKISLRNVPGVLKRKKNKTKQKNLGGGGEFFFPTKFFFPY